VVIVFSLVSGLLAYASFAPLDYWWCAPFSLALLIHVLSDHSLRHRVMAVVVFGASFFGPLLAWSNTYVGDVPWLLLTLLQIMLLLPLSLLPMSKIGNLFLFPSIWVAGEFLRGHYPFNGFGWGRIAFSQASAPYALAAGIGGAPLLSYLVAFMALGIYFSFKRRLTIAAIVLISVLIFTTIAFATLPAMPKKTFSIVAVQGEVPSLGLDFNSRATAVFENHLRTTVDYFKREKIKPQVVLWPENSIDVDPFLNIAVENHLDSVVNNFNTPFIVGAVLRHGSNFQNASILWEPRIGATSIYVKRHLTPFGEYIPLRSIAELISPYAKNVVDFLPGNRVIVHAVGDAKIAPIICFELLDDASGRAMARASNLFVVQTNSATFGISPESDQQLGIARIRAIEHRRYSISISTSGVSAIIDPRGRVTGKTEKNQRAVITSVVGLNNSRSPADKFGSQWEFFLILFPPILVAGRGAGRREIHNDY
jgi:apolipoprotein N-acyltransferase